MEVELNKDSVGVMEQRRRSKKRQHHNKYFCPLKCWWKERLASHEAPHEQQFYNSFKPSMSFASPVMVV